jgi:predicted Fe-S protein YdhL (DUF1289 family)
MPIFPKIQSPCPYKSNLAAVMDGEMCRACKRNVFDLTAMSDGERLAFLAGCEEEVCVSYRIPRAAFAAAALAAAAASSPAMGQEVAAPETEVAIDSASVPYDETQDIFVGGIKDPRSVEMVQVDTDTSVPELPVVYDGEEGADALTAEPGPAGT